MVIGNIPVPPPTPPFEEGERIADERIPLLPVAIGIKEGQGKAHSPVTFTNHFYCLS